MVTLFDYLAGREIGLDHLAREAVGARLALIGDRLSGAGRRRAGAEQLRHGALPPPAARRALSRRAELARASRLAPLALLDLRPAADPPDGRRRRSDLGGRPARDFAAERADRQRQSVRGHRRRMRRELARRRPAAVARRRYSEGSARAAWAGAGRPRARRPDRSPLAGDVGQGAAGQPPLVVLPLEHGFTAPGDLAVLAEQDILGDRLARPRAKRAKRADKFLAEARRPGRGRPGRPCRPRHRPLRGAGDPRGRRRAARLPEDRL